MKNTYEDHQHLLQDNVNNYLQAATFLQEDISKELVQELEKYNFVWFLSMQIKKYNDHDCWQDIQFFLRDNMDTIADFEKEVAELKEQIRLGNKNGIRDFSKKRTDPSMRIFTS